MPSARECIGVFSDRELNPEARSYLAFHAPRFAFLIDLINQLAAGKPVSILDVGPGFQSDLLRRYVPGAKVHTLGYADPRFPSVAGETHMQIDLNDTQVPGRCPDPAGVHDIIVFAEVIEHLYTAPEIVLGYLAGWLKPGGWLVLQTPNAAALAKRLVLLRGRNPYERIRLQSGNPGHFREYTLGELLEIGAGAGLRNVGWTCRNYFDVRGLKSRVYDAVCAVLPRSFSNGYTLWFRKEG